MIDFKNKLSFIHIPKNAGTSVEVALGFKKLKGFSKHNPAYAHLGYWHPKVNHREYPFQTEGHRALRINNPPDPKLVSAFKDFHKFAIVRNPWDRLVSTWKYDTKFLESDYTTLVPNPYSKSSRAWVDRRRKFIRNFRDKNGSEFKDFVKNLSLTWFGAKGKRPYINIDEAKFPFVDFVPYRWIRWHRHSQCTFVYGPNNKLLVDSILRMENLKDDWSDLMNKLNLDIELPHENSSSGKPYQDYYENSTMVDVVARRYVHDINLFNYTFM